MTLQNWITLIVAILGVLHGPATGALLKSLSKTKSAK